MEDFRELLDLYKYCDEKAKDILKGFMAECYFIKYIDGMVETKQDEDLYYIAREYAEGNDAWRQEKMKEYIDLVKKSNGKKNTIRMNILPIFQDEDFECDDTSQEEYKHYCFIGGFSLSKEDKGRQ